MGLKDLCLTARQKAGLTQKEFAVRVGTNQTEISFIERGFVPPSRNKVNTIKSFAKNILEQNEGFDETTK